MRKKNMLHAVFLCIYNILSLIIVAQTSFSPIDQVQHQNPLPCHSKQHGLHH